jgi:ERCC4-related helicase
VLDKARSDWRANPNTASLHQSKKYFIEGDFGCLMTCTHALTQLKNYGLVQFHSYIVENIVKVQGTKLTTAKKEIRNSPEFARMIGLLDAYLNEGAVGAGQGIGIAIGSSASHPKLQKLVELLRDHFQGQQQQKEPLEPLLNTHANANEGANRSPGRVIIFTAFRESVMEIVQLLSQQQFVRPVAFVGQNATGGTTATTAGPGRPSAGKKNGKNAASSKNIADFNLALDTSKWDNPHANQNDFDDGGIDVNGRNIISDNGNDESGAESSNVNGNSMLLASDVNNNKRKGKGMTQSEQQRILDAFKQGVYNTLVATSIGEEGLDIGT